MRDTNYVVTDGETEKNQSREGIKIGKSSGNVPGTRAQQNHHPRNKNYEQNTKRIKASEFRDEAGYKWHQKKEHV